MVTECACVCFFQQNHATTLGSTISKIERLFGLECDRKTVKIRASSGNTLLR